jgi:hypothetical protein
MPSRPVSETPYSNLVRLGGPPFIENFDKNDFTGSFTVLVHSIINTWIASSSLFLFTDSHLACFSGF